MSSLQKKLLSLFLAFTTVYGVVEIINELQNLIRNEESLWHVVFEISFVIASLLALLYFTYIVYLQYTSHCRLEASLLKVKKNLESANIRLQEGKREFFKTIQWQFKQWHLTPSEQQVALLILKGCSIKEIAKIRSTKEKTVRNQASAIYNKSALTGRHELSAWFFEDML
jgi:DNA-binding CsgD family transcriptional regulator